MKISSLTQKMRSKLMSALVIQSKGHQDDNRRAQKRVRACICWN
jgi:hypothetical protein